jgi:hypothetical protein
MADFMTSAQMLRLRRRDDYVAGQPVTDGSLQDWPEGGSVVAQGRRSGQP